MYTLKEIFKMWRDAATDARYDRWCEEHVDDLIWEVCRDYSLGDPEPEAAPAFS